MILPLGYALVVVTTLYVLFSTAGPSGVTLAALFGTIFGLFLLGLVVIGLRFPGSGARQLDWDPRRGLQQADDDEITSVLERINAARIRDGRPAITEHDLRREAGTDLDDFWPGD